MQLKFSVITPSYNQGNYIEQTITSVLEQEYPDFEHIVVDGGSTDKTLAILKKYIHLSWVSEKDQGQAAAVNKGLRMASGEVIAWLNSDDWFEPGAFKAVADFFSLNPDKNVVMGDCNLVDEKGSLVGKIVNDERGLEELKQFWIARAIPTQPAVFFRRSLIDKVGLLDESLHLAMDYDLWMRIAHENRFYHLDCLLVNYRFHSNAKGGDQDWRKFVPEWKLVCDRYPVANIEVPADVLSLFHCKDVGYIKRLLVHLKICV